MRVVGDSFCVVIIERKNELKLLDKYIGKEGEKLES